MLLLWLLSFAAPDLGRLGADDWHTRERESERCDCFLMALRLPACHADPEIDYRVKKLRSRNLRYLNSLYVESVLFREGFEQWVRWYLMQPGRTKLELIEVLDAIQRDPQKRETLLSVLPVQPGENSSFLNPPFAPTDLPRFEAYLSYHWYPAPMPRQKHPAGVSPCGGRGAW